MSLDPRIAHQLSPEALTKIVPGVNNRGILMRVRDEFAAYLLSPAGLNRSTWQEAWNAFTDAHPGAPGEIVVTHPGCDTCHGHRYVVEAGQSPAACPQCLATGIQRPTNVKALYVAPGDGVRKKPTREHMKRMHEDAEMWDAAWGEFVAAHGRNPTSDELEREAADFIRHCY